MDEIKNSLNSLKSEVKSNLNTNKRKNMYNESEIIVKYIFEKLLSLTISSSFKNKIERILPDYCMKEMDVVFELLTQVDFMSHDKDDIEISKKIKDICKIKSGLNLNNNIKIDKTNINEKVSLSKTAKNIEYELQKDFDPNYETKIFSFDSRVLADKNKKITLNNNENIDNNENNENNDNGEILIFDILKRKISTEKLNNKNKSKEISNKNKEPFKIKSIEKIENIKKVEEHKIEIQEDNFFKEQNLPFRTEINGKNFWGVLNEPKPSTIDRSATTKIKFKIPLKLKSRKYTVDKKYKIKEELKNVLSESSSPQKEKNDHKKKHRSIKKEENNDNNKKKKYPQIEFSSYDINPNRLDKRLETKELFSLRSEMENQIEQKKIQMQKQLEKEKELENKEQAQKELEKQLQNKNITVDIDGNIVFVKPLQENLFINDFRKGKSKSRQIKLIEAPIIPINKTNIVEKNPNENGDNIDNNKNKIKDKLKKKLKLNNRHKNLNHKNGNNISQSSINQKKNIESLSEKRERMKYINGSNFNMINLECGVTIKEENKLKSGGKNFLEKYNKYSIEIFKELSKTFSSSFYRKTEKVNSLDSNTNINDNNKKKEVKEEKSKNKNKNKNKTVPIDENDKINVKTYNLNLALKNLDLITEGEEKLFRNKKMHNQNIINIKKRRNSTKKLGNDYGEMNIFAKTIMDGEWTNRITTNLQKYKELKCKTPIKPENIELGRELPLNILKHLPRKRLPPINSLLKGNMLNQTISDSFRKKKSDKGRNKKYQSTSSNFYKNSIS